MRELDQRERERGEDSQVNTRQETTRRGLTGLRLQFAGKGGQEQRRTDGGGGRGGGGYWKLPPL